jgi:hypothetical protein
VRGHLIKCLNVCLDHLLLLCVGIKSNTFVCARVRCGVCIYVFMWVFMCVRVGIGESEQLGWSARTHSENVGGFHRRIRRVGVVDVHVYVCMCQCVCVSVYVSCVSMCLNSCLHISVLVYVD